MCVCGGGSLLVHMAVTSPKREGLLGYPSFTPKGVLDPNQIHWPTRDLDIVGDCVCVCVSVYSETHIL